MASNRRKDTNYFGKFEVSSGSFDIRAKWSFTSVGIALLVESNDVTDVIQYSFDGVNVHGDLTPTLPSEGIIYDSRYESNVYLRRATPGPSVTVRIEAWRHQA